MEEKRLKQVSMQKIRLEKFDPQDFVLDIGGGGEGIIGRFLGEKVISIDKNKKELLEAVKAHSSALNILMDARDLKFLEKSFNYVTSFFTLMYIPKNERFKVLKEIFRVLRPNGLFKIWDVEIPEYEGGLPDVFVVPLKITFSNQKIETGYGVKWEEHEQSIKDYIKTAEKIGFEVTKKRSEDKIFKLDLRKPLE